MTSPIGAMRDDPSMRRELAQLRAVIDTTLSAVEKIALHGIHDAMRDWAAAAPRIGLLAASLLILEMQTEWDAELERVSPGARDAQSAESPPPFVGSEDC